MLELDISLLDYMEEASSFFLGYPADDDIKTITIENWKKIYIIKPNSKLFSCTINCIDGNLKYDEKIKEWIKVGN